MNEETPSLEEAGAPEMESAQYPRAGKFAPFVGRLDLLAILMAVVGVGLLGVAGVVMAVVEIAKLIAGLWTDPLNRWLVIALGLAILWVLVRRKRWCVF